MAVLFGRSRAESAAPHSGCFGAPDQGVHVWLWSAARPIAHLATGVTVAALMTACGGGSGSGSGSTEALASPTTTVRDEDNDDDSNIDERASVIVDPANGSDTAFRAGILSAALARGTLVNGASPLAVSVAPTNGGPRAHIEGAFGPAFNWPLVAIHLVLLPDGRVMSYGTNRNGGGGADLNYTVWNPSMGAGPESMLNLPNTTRTNIFCGGQLVLPGTGEVLLLGGTAKDVYGRSGYGVSDIGLFDPATNTISKQPESMAERRWYGTIVTTAQGEQVILGGRSDKGYPSTDAIPETVVATYASAPAVYSAGQGWRSLGTASSDFAYGAKGNSWSYPKSWWAPNGTVFVLGRTGAMYGLDIEGTGSLVTYKTKTLIGLQDLSAAMFAPGKILALRDGGQAVVIDINGPTPVATVTQPLSAGRVTGVATILADGKVWANGGSTTRLVLSTAVYHSEIWDPATSSWALAASAAKARLYHSTALLLPDATVLTAGGGRPGPVTNLNAEVYFPPYLYKRDGSGELAERPGITSIPDRGLLWDESIPVGVTEGTQVSRVTLIRSGSMTHSFNNEQRFTDVSFVQDGASVTISMPRDSNVAPPGYYMLFVFNAEGVPSIARLVRLGGSTPALTAAK